MRAGWVLVLVAWAAAGEPPAPVRISVEATGGRLIPQSKGGGFQRTFRFTATPGAGNHWIRQELAVRGTVLDADGVPAPVHLDVVEYYRVDSSGRAIQYDCHHSQHWDHRAGELTVRSTLTYGTLEARKPGDTIVGRSFLLRSATDARGEPVTLKTRKGRVIPAERGARVTFHADDASLPTTYGYAVEWDTRASRTRPAGAIEVGTFRVEVPETTGPTVARDRPRPIPLLETGR